MSTYPPKLDKARKEWLASLKEGDEVASASERDGERICPAIGRVQNSFYEYISGGGSRSYSLNSGRSPAPTYGAQDGGQRYLVPVTDEIRRRVRLRTWLAMGPRIQWQDVTDEQIEAIAKILGWAP